MNISLLNYYFKKISKTLSCLNCKVSYFSYLFVSDLGACAITAIPFEKSKVLFSLEETDDFVLVDETEPSISTERMPEHTPDLSRSVASAEKWGWIMFECGIENLTVKGTALQYTRILFHFRSH